MKEVGKPTVLTFVRYYLPGYKSGGPIRSIANLVACLNGEINFRIVTSDRDASDRAAYDGVKIDAWNSVGNAQVYYASQGRMNLFRVVRMLRQTQHNMLYLNSFFGARFTTLPLLARRLGVSRGSDVVLAPRGEFSKGALRLKAWKKLPYIGITRTLGLYRGVIWQASSTHEADDIRRVFGSVARIVVAPDLPTWSNTCSAGSGSERNRKEPLKVIFISRIVPMKNLDFALRVLKQVLVPVEFTIAGPISDKDYWLRCKTLIGGLPGHISVKLMGHVEHGMVSSLLAQNDLFFLPTRGENYGHIIAEAINAGTPVLISDVTPWRGLSDAGVGWDIPLEEEERFMAAIESAAGKDGSEYIRWRRQVADYAKVRLNDPSVIQANRQLFCDPFQIG